MYVVLLFTLLLAYSLASSTRWEYRVGWVAHCLRSMRRWLYLPVLLLGVLKLTCAFHHSRRLCLRLPSLQVDTGRTHDVSNLDVYSLDSVRSTLIRQEETIIFALIERAQYRRNKKIYDSRNTNLTNSNDDPISFLEWMFIETEKLHAKVRRYTSPEEHPFFPDFLPSPILPALQYPEILKQETADINVNAEIMKWYIGGVIERLCEEGDDEQHGSSVLCDITAMQAISRRIHFGKFVAGMSVFFSSVLLDIIYSHLTPHIDGNEYRIEISGRPGRLHRTNTSKRRSRNFKATDRCRGREKSLKEGPFEGVDVWTRHFRDDTVVFRTQ